MEGRSGQFEHLLAPERDTPTIYRSRLAQRIDTEHAARRRQNGVAVVTDRSASPQHLWLVATFTVLLLAFVTATPARAAEPERSIREWARCDGTADDRDATAAAFAAAAGGKFMLRVDCPLRLAIGMDVRRPIFIDNGTTVRFTGAGSITVDNVFQPAFVIADTHDVVLEGWKLRFSGRIPLDPTLTPGFAAANANRSRPSLYPFAADFNDQTLTRWLAARRGVRTDHATAEWHGPAACWALLAVIGDSSRITIANMTMTGLSPGRPDRFIPVGITFLSGFAAGTTATAVTTASPSPALEIPHTIQIDGLTLDNYLVGILGNVRDASIRRVRAYRYSDLQGREGPVGAGWFPPPHLIYLRSRAPGRLANRNVTITDVIDYGQVIGAPRESGGSAVSLKIGADDSLVDGYQSDRPEGVFQPLTSTRLTIRNVTGRYDSRFSPQHEGAVRFVNGPYTNVEIEHVDVTDVAPQTQYPPITGPSASGSSGIVLRDVQIRVRYAAPLALAAPRFARGSTNLVDVRIEPGAF